MQTNYDVIIIGVRVAGSILATRLGQMGYRVLGIDRAIFPSDTLSTHFFRAPALRAFAEIDVLEKVKSVAPRLTVNYNVIDGITFPETVDRPEDYPFYMCIRRITLDDILVQKAREMSKVEIMEGTKVTDLLYQDDTVMGVKWKSENGAGEARAKVVVGADGVRSFVAKKVKPQVELHEPINRAMYYAYYSGFPANEGPAAEFHYNGNTIAYCMPCDNNLTLLAVSVPISEFDHFKHDAENEFIKNLKLMKEISTRLDYAKIESPVKGSGSIPGYMRIPFGDGWALVGDSGMAMDPWSGQGIDQSSTHALLMAKHLADYFSGSKWQTAMQAYHKERNEFSIKAFKRTCKFSVDLRPMTKAALENRGLA